MINSIYLAKYRAEFVKMIADNSKEVSDNHSRLHANVIIQELVRHAEEFVYIQCSNFAHDIYGNPETKAIIRNALLLGRNVKIFVRNAIQEVGFAAELNDMKEGTVLSNKSVSELDFCVTDSYRYRQEVDKEKGMAKVCANGREVADQLVECFERGLEHA